MTDVGFVVAGYSVILGGLALYTGTLLRRLAHARAVARAADRGISKDATVGDAVPTSGAEAEAGR